MQAILILSITQQQQQLSHGDRVEGGPLVAGASYDVPSAARDFRAQDGGRLTLLEQRRARWIAPASEETVLAGGDKPLFGGRELDGEDAVDVAVQGLSGMSGLR